MKGNVHNMLHLRSNSLWRPSTCGTHAIYLGAQVTAYMSSKDVDKTLLPSHCSWPQPSGGWAGHHIHAAACDRESRAPGTQPSLIAKGSWELDMLIVGTAGTASVGGSTPYDHCILSCAAGVTKQRPMSLMWSTCEDYWGACLPSLDLDGCSFFKPSPTSKILNCEYSRAGSESKCRMRYPSPAHMYMHQKTWYSIMYTKVPVFSETSRIAGWKITFLNTDKERQRVWGRCEPWLRMALLLHHVVNHIVIWWRGGVWSTSTHL